MDFKSSSNREKIITIICIVGMTLWVIFSCSNFYEDDQEENNDEYEEEYTQTYQNQETEDTSIAPWMIGTWKGSLNYSDMNIFWSLEIDEYGNTTQIIYNPQGGSEVELLHLKYDRISQQLYYKDGGLNITIEVDANNKCLYMPSAYGTLYFKKN
jgi:hypothetical protein